MASLLAPPEALANLLQRDLDEAAARQALEGASGDVRTHCGWFLSRQTVTGFVPRIKCWTRAFWLPSLHVVSVEQVVVNEVVLVEGTDYGWTDYGRVYRPWFGYWTELPVTVDFTHGYDTDDYRMDTVRRVVLAAAARRLGNPAAHTAETTGRESWTAGQASAGLTDDEKADLGPITLEEVGAA